MRMHTWVYTHMCVFSLAVDYRSNGDGGARVSELLRHAGLYIYACMNICEYVFMIMNLTLPLVRESLSSYDMLIHMYASMYIYVYMYIHL